MEAQFNISIGKRESMFQVTEPSEFRENGNQHDKLQGACGGRSLIGQNWGDHVDELQTKLTDQ